MSTFSFLRGWLYMKNKWNKPYQIVMIVISVITGVMGIAFLVQTLRIYSAKGNPMYSRELVGEYLLQILAVLIIWVIAVIVGIVFSYLNHNNKKEFVKTTNIVKLNTLASLLPSSLKEGQATDSYLKECKKRKIAWYIVLGILLVCLIMGSLYLFNVKHFIYDGNPTEQIKKMVVHLLPWLIISFGSLIGMVIYEEWNAKKCIPLVKDLLNENGKQKPTPFVQSKRKNLILNITRGALVVCAITLIIVGALTGGADGVLQKAINICTECIGLG